MAFPYTIGYTQLNPLWQTQYAYVTLDSSLSHNNNACVHKYLCHPVSRSLYTKDDVGSSYTFSEKFTDNESRND